VPCGGDVVTIPTALAQPNIWLIWSEAEDDHKYLGWPPQLAASLCQLWQRHTPHSAAPVVPSNLAGAVSLVQRGAARAMPRGPGDISDPLIPAIDTNRPSSRETSEP
jgi:hypothetical protein